MLDDCAKAREPGHNPTILRLAKKGVAFLKADLPGASRTGGGGEVSTAGIRDASGSRWGWRNTESNCRKKRQRQVETLYRHSSLQT